MLRVLVPIGMAVAMVLAVPIGAANASLQWKPLFVDPLDAIEGCAEVRSLLPVDDGAGSALFAAGEFAVAGSATVNHVARWDGVLWLPLGGGFASTDETTHAVVRSLLHFRGQLIAGGQFERAGAVAAPGIARWDGDRWHAIPALGEANVDHMLEWRGRVLAIGGFGTAEYNPVLSWDGVTVSPMRANLPEGAEIVAAGVHRDIPLLGGRFPFVDRVETLLAWNGAAWERHAASLPDCEQVTAIASEGDALFVGCASSAPLAATVWSLASSDQWTLMERDTLASHAQLALVDDQLVAGFGRQQTAYGRVVRWDGEEFVQLGPPMVGSPLSIVGFGGEVVVGGSMVRTGNDPLSCVARLAGDRWRSLGNHGRAAVAAWAGLEDSLVAVGSFALDSANGEMATGIARWDGIQWHRLGSGVEGVGRAATLHAGQLHVAGAFLVNGDDAQSERLLRWDGTEWNVESNMDPETSKLISVGGSLVGLRYETLAPIARWSGDHWIPHAVVTGTVADILEFDGHLIAGGLFRLAPSDVLVSVARHDDVSGWVPLGNPVGMVRALGAHAGRLHVATQSQVFRFVDGGWEAVGDALHDVSSLVSFRGELYAFGGHQHRGLFRLDGVAWARLSDDASHSAWEALVEHAGDLVVGGSFLAQGDLVSPGMAAFGPTEQPQVRIVGIHPAPVEAGRPTAITVEIEGETAAPTHGLVTVRSSPGGSCTGVIDVPLDALRSQVACELTFTHEGPASLSAIFHGSAASAAGSWQPGLSDTLRIGIGPHLFGTGFESWPLGR